jgi:hypothetical protein
MRKRTLAAVARAAVHRTCSTSPPTRTALCPARSVRCRTWPSMATPNTGFPVGQTQTFPEGVSFDY